MTCRAEVAAVWQEAECLKDLPAGPKKPLNAYMIFASEHRATVKEENPTFSAPAIAKLLGEMWGAMSSEDRIPWVGKANEEKEKYAAALKHYQEQHGALPSSSKQPTKEQQQVMNYLALEASANAWSRWMLTRCSAQCCACLQHLDAGEISKTARTQPQLQLAFDQAACPLMA